MRQFFLSVAVVGGLLLIICGNGILAQQPNDQRRDVEIFLTASDKDQNFVTSLKAEDLRIVENGIAQQITSLRPITDRSLSLAILIDTSLSQERTLDAQKTSAVSFIESVIRPGRDQAAIATFTGTLRVEQELTNQLSLLQQAIQRAVIVVPPGYVGGGVVVSRMPPSSNSPAALAGSTAIWDAVIEACTEMLSRASNGSHWAIILLTDGLDTISKRKLGDAVNRANREDIAVYAIGIGDERYGIDKDPLRKLSERTGGRAFFPKKIADLPQIFTQIEQHLRNQYLLSYNSTQPLGADEKIKIEIVNPILKDVKLFYQISKKRP